MLMEEQRRQQDLGGFSFKEENKSSNDQTPIKSPEERRMQREANLKVAAEIKARPQMNNNQMEEWFRPDQSSKGTN